MENTIMCANCGEGFVLPGGTIQLPWLCGECARAAEFQEKIAPPTVALDPKPHECGEGCTDAGCDPSCDTASVEATTQLIAELEAQVKTLTASNDGLADIVVADNKVIEDLKSQLDAAVTKNQEYEETEAMKEYSDYMSFLQRFGGPDERG